MIPGEIRTPTGARAILANGGLAEVTLAVANTGDRPIQVGSHFHFFEVNSALSFDREKARGFRLNIPAGNAVRFEPGDMRRCSGRPWATRCGSPTPTCGSRSSAT